MAEAPIEKPAESLLTKMNASYQHHPHQNDQQTRWSCFFHVVPTPKGSKSTAQGAALGSRKRFIMVALKGRYSCGAWSSDLGAPESRPFRAAVVGCHETQGCALGYGITPLRGYSGLRPFIHAERAAISKAGGMHGNVN